MMEFIDRVETADAVAEIASPCWDRRPLIIAGAQSTDESFVGIPIGPMGIA